MMSCTFTLANLTDINFTQPGSYCPAQSDGGCWPPTKLNHTATIACPPSIQGVDRSKFALRECLLTGKWDRIQYKPCFYPDVWELMNKYYVNKSPGERQAYTDVLQAVRIIEMVGLSVSFISVILSLCIFCCLKSLYCSRTKIHINLLLAILLQIVARIINYGIQMKYSQGDNRRMQKDQLAVELPKYIVLICPFIVIGLQFGISAMFMWMLCEGVHLNNVLTVSVFKNKLRTLYFHLLGWGVPFCLTLSWSIVMFFKQRDRQCWSNYNYLPYYWIIDGPRYAVMIVAFKGGAPLVPDLKAVKAAIFLLPLLGITHMLETFVTPDDQSIVLFAIYFSVTYFMSTFQGFFCSLLYCFLNTEVRETISRRLQTTQFWSRWKSCLRNKDRNDRERTRMESLLPQSSPSKKTHIELNDRLDGENNMTKPILQQEQLTHIVSNGQSPTIQC
ncbi:unnamed protein product [Didymodactylos carnosus]|uniref:Uncharacterized protein n=1 Tax=Didymodactylos carnosus TaxID=1234261 RepID=A0A813USK2_9BILA|nr:unnamed protein product [Didymodactylos carnosus]CAF0834210.1 unnamed protein product [Didymodactylos carnosus]CAF3569234.1 unnamed protein product [Didymodactylos carnosus]CAF3621341.1 unnamed protein product [Didymodactylos carnosus]